MPSALDTMPQPGTAQWAQWFQKQDPNTQAAVLWSFGFQNANAQPDSATAGGFAPEMTPGQYDTTSGLAAPVDLNTKGKVVPFDLNTAATTTNVVQDRNSMMVDPTVALLSGAGAYDPSAFTPRYEPVGDPVVQGGAKAATAYSKAGGWQGYIARAILAGDTPSEAYAKLQQIVIAPQSATADPEKLAERNDILNSLPRATPFVNTQTSSGVPELLKEDLTTPQGFAKAIDIKALNDFGDKLFQGIVNDPEIKYTDPNTQLGYAGAKAVDTPTMEFYRKNGIPFPTESYANPNYTVSAADQAGGGPLTPEELAQRVAAPDLAEKARVAALTKYQGLDQSYKDASQPMNPAASTAANQAPWKGPGSLGYDPYNPGPLVQELPGGGLKSYPMAPGAEYLKGQTGPVPSGVQSMDPAQINKMAGQNPGGMLRGTNPRPVTQQDIAALAQQKSAAFDQLRKAIEAKTASQQLSDPDMQRVLAAMRMRALASQGRTPTQDSLNQRLLTIRNQGVLGY